METKETIKIPTGLNDLARKTAQTILETIGPEIDTGGCRLFYSPQEWKERGEEYGLKSLLIVVWWRCCTLVQYGPGSGMWVQFYRNNE